MVKDELKKYFETLELPPDASLRDIHNSYLRLKKLYAGDSIVLAPLGEEFPEKKRKKVLDEIEEAYVKILTAKKDEPSRTAFLFEDAPPQEKASEPEKAVDFPATGPILRKIRENAGIDLDEISKELKLRVELLKNLEEERFEALPEAIYLRVHLKNYALLLGLNPAKVTDDYLQRYQAWKKKK